jgi:Asp-tRNA(Asn)/Glu-tRNA(Gln) amidotransferase A subunit family amidase
MALATKGLNTFSAAEAARLIASGEITSEALVRACLERISEREPNLHAWAALDLQHALAQARQCDRIPPRGPLHGVPIGIKDIIDTADLPTEMGSPIYKGHRPAADAACVASLRAGGAVILGKTITCEFAGMTPDMTANPHNLAHTPGGSSSGSAAAVADFQVPAALGTQTGGSVIRPAAFCGIVGYKPSFGLINRRGVFPAAESLDTVGIMARTVEDVDLVAAHMIGRERVRRDGAAPPRIGLCRTPLWDSVERASAEAVEDAAKRLAAAGAQIQEIILPKRFAGLTEARDHINDYERARALAYEWAAKRDQISSRLTASLTRGHALQASDFMAALELAESCRTRLPALMRDVDMLLAPAVPGEAPRGLDFTGDPRLQGIWTLLRVPTVTLPTHGGPGGLPVGIQLVGKYCEDEALLGSAFWVFDRLGAWRM